MADQEKYYAVERLAELKAAILRESKAMVVNRAKVEKYREADLAAAKDCYLELKKTKTALEKAIGLKPDVIFFLTDADEEISPLVLAKIRELRLKVGVDQIHVMEFGNPESKRPASYRRLAEQNNGQYIYKDIRTM